MKFSVTGRECGASDTGAITQVNGKYLMPFGTSPNDMLKRHRAAQDGVQLFPSTRIMEGGNRFEAATREWFEDDHGIKVTLPRKGFKNKHCNLVASLDGQIDCNNFMITDYQGMDHTINGLIPIDFKYTRTMPKDPVSLSYVLQIQAQIDCTDAQSGILAYLTRDTFDWCIVVINRHEPTIKAIRDSVNVFWDHMKNDTDYPPVTSSEASAMIDGNRRPEPVDLIVGPTEEIKNDARTELADAAHNWLAAKRAIDASKEMMEHSSKIMKVILGGHESALLPDGVKISHKTVEFKAQPEKTKVTPAKDAHTSRRFKVEIKNAQ